jgi:polyhydroxybutyrate depolymerase
MAHTMACTHADRFAAIVSLAGSMPLDPADCAPSAPVAVLQVHGTADATIPYAGAPGRNPGAVDVAERWAALDGCPPTPADGPPLDLEGRLAGAETSVTAYGPCAAGTDVELWTIEGGAHIPEFNDSFVPDVIDWLLAHPRTA